MLLETYNQPWDFELLDTGDGFRLERWGGAAPRTEAQATGIGVILSRPDPQIIWKKSLPESEWQKANAKFVSGRGEEKGKWDIKSPLPNPWVIQFQNNKFLLKLSPFKHTGIFAEQAAQWSWMINRLMIKDFRLKAGTKILNPKSKILNLFAYTGAASIVLANNNCQVTHVDASKPAITWANENYKLNFGSEMPFDFAQGERSPKGGNVRWILDDAAKFAAREVKRGAKYDGIIMDPPAFGHSPTGKTWKFNDNLPELLADCVKLLSDNAKFLIINSYATNSSALSLNNLLEDAMRLKAKSTGSRIEFGELCLKQKSGRMISTGIFSRWSSNDI